MIEGESITFIVPEGVSRVRADKVLAEHFTEFSRTQIQRTFEAGQVKRDGKIIDKKTPIFSEDKLEVAFLHPKETTVCPVDIPLDILYEDENVVAVNKSPGMVVHPGKGTSEDTMVHALLHHTQGKLSLMGGEERPGVVHRLDKETSGVILFAKTDNAYLYFVNAFSNREIQKEYLALVSGVPSLESGTVKEPIDRHPKNPVKMAVKESGRYAHTDWAIEKKLGSCALLRCWLHTGRTHQIRVHLSYIGHPILGDYTYGYRFKKEHILKPERVLLHAELIKFKHPVTKETLTIKAPLPGDLKDQIAILSQD